MPAFVDPNSIFNPAPLTAPPAAWGDTIRDMLVMLNGLMPIGSIMTFPSLTAPSDNFLRAEGQTVSRVTYAALNTLLSGEGYPFGAGDGSTTFHLPDLRGKVVVGYYGSDTEFNVIGETGGAKTHTLSSGEVPAHTHTMPHTHDMTHAHAGVGNGGSVGFAKRQASLGGADDIYNSGANTNLSWWDNPPTSTYAASTGAASNGTTSSVGSGGAHNNLQPYITLVPFIRVQ